MYQKCTRPFEYGKFVLKDHVLDVMRISALLFVFGITFDYEILNERKEDALSSTADRILEYIKEKFN